MASAWWSRSDPGNNGGGGLVAARHLANRGANLRVILARPALRMTEAARHQLATLIAMGSDCCVATYDLTDADLETVLAEADVVVDAVLGYRIHDAPRGEAERLIGFVIRSGRPVVSLDLPSGIDPDSGEAAGIAITASATLTLALPKPGLLRGAGVAQVRSDLPRGSRVAGGALHCPRDPGRPAVRWLADHRPGSERMTQSSPSRSFTEKIGLLSEVALFAGLSEADMQAIGHATTMTHCTRGQQIMAPDDPPDRIHIIKKGRVRVYRMSPEGKQLTLDIYEKGTILGDMDLLGQDPLPEAYAEALDDGVVCTITPDELKRLIERYPSVGLNIIRHLSGAAPVGRA